MLAKEKSAETPSVRTDPTAVNGAIAAMAGPHPITMGSAVVGNKPGGGGAALRPRPPHPALPPRGDGSDQRSKGSGAGGAGAPSGGGKIRAPATAV